METVSKKVNPVSLAREILNFRKTKHPYGFNYAVRVGWAMRKSRT